MLQTEINSVDQTQGKLESNLINGGYEIIYSTLFWSNLVIEQSTQF